MMGINWRWLLAGLFLYFCLLVAYLPASQVVSRISLPDNVKVGNVQGTLWQGEVDRVIVNNIPVKQAQGKDFNALDTFKRSAEAAGFTVEQGAINNRDDAVIGTMNIRGAS